MSSLNRREFLAGAGAVASSVAMGRGVGDFAGKLFYISKNAKKNNVPLCKVGKLAPSNPYVTDGLIAMWDGEWNAGIGVHDGSATAWKDLVSGVDCEAIGSPTWGDKCFVSPSTASSPFFDAYTPDLSNTDGHTVEFISLKSSANRGVIFGSFGLSGGNNCSFEYYVKNFRSYYNGNPELTIPVDSWPLNEIKYFASLRSGDVYSICGADGAVISTITSTRRPMTASHMRIGTDSRTSVICFHGNIYAIRIYNRALTAAEIAANYAVDKARFNI